MDGAVAVAAPFFDGADRVAGSILFSDRVFASRRSVSTSSASF
ncbi:hypothetical protein PO002_17380 [Cupriavidus necator]